MDKAYEGNETRQLVLDLGMVPVVPPKSNRVDVWEYDRELYKKRNEIERLFRRLKGFRRIFSRFEKLDVVFLAFLYFALIVEALACNLNTPESPCCRSYEFIHQTTRHVSESLSPVSAILN